MPEFRVMAQCLLRAYPTLNCLSCCSVQLHDFAVRSTPTRDAHAPIPPKVLTSAMQAYADWVVANPVSARTTEDVIRGLSYLLPVV